MENQEVKKKSKQEFIEAMKRQYYEIQSIDETIADLKSEAKDAGYDGSLLAKVAKAFADNKASEIIEKNETFAATVEESRNS